MTTKSKGRRERDAQARAANGGKVATGRMSREKSSRAWYELKSVHARSQSYIQQLADRMQQYQHPLVLTKIAKNEDGAKWTELNLQLQQAAGKFGTTFAALWESHKDNKRLCLSIKDLDAAMTIYNEYQQFDMDFYNTFSPIITAMNELFNKALTQLLESQASLNEQTIADARAKLLDPTVISDVNYKEAMPAGALVLTPVDDLEKLKAADPATIGAFARGQNSASTPIDELGLIEGEPAKEFANAAPLEPHDGSAPVLGEAEVVQYQTGFGGAAA